MKLIKPLIYALIMCFSVVNVVEAKSSTSFKGGFSSQQYKTKPVAKPIKSQTENNAAFGSFSKVDQNKTSNPGQSLNSPGSLNGSSLNMSKDLDKTAVKNNALNTLDARNKTNEPLNTRANNWGRDNNLSGNSVVQNVPHPVPVVIVQQQHSGFLNNAMWFMLGHSLAQNHNNYVPVEHYGNSNNDASNATSTAVTQPEHESFMWSLLRFVLWIAFIAAIIVGFKKFIQFRKGNSIKNSRYSLRG